jgi:hypothetical protein
MRRNLVSIRLGNVSTPAEEAGVDIMCKLSISQGVATKRIGVLQNRNTRLVYRQEI